MFDPEICDLIFEIFIKMGVKKISDVEYIKFNLLNKLQSSTFIQL